MATMEEMMRLEAETNRAESEALHALAAHLREAVTGLPVHSRLAMSFAKHSREFDGWASHYGHTAQMGDLSLCSLLRDVAADSPPYPDDDEDDD